MEPLIELPRDRWPELRDLFKLWWPHGVAGYKVLDTQYRKPALSHGTGFRVYCPWGDMNNGAVALNGKGTLNEVIILPTTTEVKKLEEALEKTKLIDWTPIMCLPFCDTDVLGIVNRLCPKLQIKQIKSVPTMRIFRSQKAPFYEDIEFPPGTYVASVKLENITQVDEVWPHRYPTSPEFFKLLINNGCSYGLYSSENDSLLTWVFINEVGFLTHLYSDDKHRGKGYAVFLMKYVSNQEAREGRDLWAHILESNHASLNLFRKIEYEVIGRGVWIYVSSDFNAKLAY